ncbi:hypothetical protein BJ742DRAFT_873944 [Cladochytrium replicatum]|nr:hypothetical protein BJ742DRAFT_873944 [Cladochytrium replicatum]
MKPALIFLYLAGLIGISMLPHALAVDSTVAAASASPASKPAQFHPAQAENDARGSPSGPNDGGQGGPNMDDYESDGGYPEEYPEEYGMYGVPEGFEVADAPEDFEMAAPYRGGRGRGGVFGYRYGYGYRPYGYGIGKYGFYAPKKVFLSKNKVLKKFHNVHIGPVRGSVVRASGFPGYGGGYWY